MSTQKYDAVVVGSGWAGAVAAERLASHGKQVLVIEQRSHVGGNCSEEVDSETGVLYHPYGPHIFHTDSEQVVQYLSRFTGWRTYQHRVVADIAGSLVPLPFNLNTLASLFPRRSAARLEGKLVAAYKLGARIPILELLSSADPEIKELADFVYRYVFVNYSAKQWGKRPDEISPEVTARVPIVLSRDDRYFSDRWQIMPTLGFNPVFKKLLFRRGVHLMLNTRWQEVLERSDDDQFFLFGQPFRGTLVYTAPIDELFGFEYGELPYRTLQFEYERRRVEWAQPVAVVNYPNLGSFTRVTEYKHLSAQEGLPDTLLAREFPNSYDRQDPARNIPYYPIFDVPAQALYSRYAERAKRLTNLTLIGRLAEYKYYDQDDVIAAALAAKI